MAVTVAPASSPAANSPSPTDSNSPQTPVSPDAVQTLALPPPNDGTQSQASANNTTATATLVKRKPSRRANTAERRATHNAVERQRRETLNGRFLDLAALLPNLSQIRRPSKSSIVNSSIAYIHASRRHRLMAARELRLVKSEADALRREVNEWRDRSGLPRTDEPLRGEAFQMVMNGEVEMLNTGPIEEEDGAGDYAGDEFGDEDYVGGTGNAGPADGHMHTEGPSSEEMRTAATIAMLKNGSNGSDVNPFAHNVSGAGPQGLHLQTILPRPSTHGGPSPMIIHSPTGVSFENPAMAAMYEPHSQMHINGGSQQYFMGGAPHMNMVPRSAHNVHEAEKVAAWNAHLYGSLGGGQGQFASPPNSSHGPGGGGSPINVPTQQHAAYLLNLQRQQAMMNASVQHGHGHGMTHSGHGRMYGSPIDGDDGSSVGSSPGNAVGVGASGATRRERSGSMNSVGSGYASSGGSNTGGNFEMAGGAGGMHRGMTGGPGPAGAQWDEGMGGLGGMGGMMKNPAAISVGGGGNGHAYAAMML